MILSEATERAEERRKSLLRNEIHQAAPHLDGDIVATNYQAQLGRAMTSTELEKRLLRINPSFIFIVSTADPTKKGLYLQVPVSVDHPKGLRFICGYENGFMPEFSLIHTRDKRIPDPDNPLEWITVQEAYKETRGWRTVLFRILKEGLATEPQLERLFNISSGRSSQRWQQALHE